MTDQVSVSRNRPCPCGSGKKCKHCCELRRKTQQAAKQRFKKIWKVSAVVAGLLLVLYGIYQIPAGNRNPSTPFYAVADLKEIDFSKLPGEKTEKILKKINSEFCTCGCRLTLAQCVATDKTCPIRSGNISLIQNLVSREGG